MNKRLELEQYKETTELHRLLLNDLKHLEEEIDKVELDIEIQKERIRFIEDNFNYNPLYEQQVLRKLLNKKRLLLNKIDRTYSRCQQ